jgi:ABC-type transporter Mla subunit MlaD
VQDFADKIATTLSHLNKLLINMNTVMGDTANQANMSELLAEAAESARQTSKLLAENRQNITESLDKLDSILENTRGIAETANARMETTINNVDSAMVAVTGLAHELRSFLTSMKDENSTLGKLMTDDELYIRLTQTLAEVDSLAVSLRTKGLRHKIVFF